jgi:homoserine dehydrogenase
VFNAVWVRGDVVGDTMYYGHGAGRDATASAVVADLVDVARNIAFGSQRRVPAFRSHGGYPDLKSMAEIQTRYYLRLQVLDHPGVLARVSGILAAQEISIASVSQHESSAEALPMVLLTHVAGERRMTRALAEIAAMQEVVEAPTVFRIEDLD